MRYPGLLKRGSGGAGVRQLQRRLIELGYRILGQRGKTLTADGDFGPVTEEAVVEFQMQSVDRRGQPLVSDGKVGPVTWEVLFDEPGVDLVRAAPGRSRASRLMSSALDIALDEVGVREVPRNSNRGEKVEQYLASVGLEPGLAWCAAFAYWCVGEASQAAGYDEVPLIRTGWTPSIWTWAKRRESFVLPDDVMSAKTKLEPGCLFLLHGTVNGTARV
ncbi:MAG: peptidoglycan-binding domain-containing protein, partial [Candidatus Latescibacteria bacterium]|nr:peptidoglycan-binding domain-containing protein [Candidatus Latescibacterota bacterium]